MKTNDQNSGNGNQQKNTVKQQQVNEPQTNKSSSDKKAGSVKNMPPIDGARPGVL
jgi:hypothetical protein